MASEATDETDTKTASESKEADNSLGDFIAYGVLPELELKECYMDEESVDKNCTPLTWSNCDATTFNVRRGPNYKPRSNQKAPSGKSLYRVFGIDTYKSPIKIYKASQFVNLADKIDEINKKGHEYNVDKWPLPPIVIINFMIPNYNPPSMLAKDQTDGDGFSLVIYAEMTEDTRLELEKLYSGKKKKEELRPSVRLFGEFVNAIDLNNENIANNTKINDKQIQSILNRFKIIVRVMNYSKSKMPYAMHPIVTKYNGKPYIAYTCSKLYHEPGRYFAVDVDAHIFSKVARKSLSYVRSCMESIVFDGGFVIEGRKDNELPEQILCCARISKIGPTVAKPFPKHLLTQYLKRKDQNTHVDLKYDRNSRSMMNLSKDDSVVNVPSTTDEDNKKGVESPSAQSVQNESDLPK